MFLKKPDLWRKNDWLLYQDNVSAPTVLKTREILAAPSTVALEYPLYSSHLAPCDFFIFPKVNKMTKESHFVTIEVIKRHI